MSVGVSRSFSPLDNLRGECVQLIERFQTLPDRQRLPLPQVFTSNTLKSGLAKIQLDVLTTLVHLVISEFPVTVKHHPDQFDAQPLASF